MDDQENIQRGKVLGVFEDLAVHYATERAELPYFQAQMEAVMAMLAGKAGNVLVIGCAAGGEIGPLRNQGFQVVGVDYAPTMLKLALPKFASDLNVTFGQADIENLPFLDASFDHVVCLGVLEFISSHETAAREMFRIMKPGGTAVIAVPSRISLYNMTFLVGSGVIGSVWRPIKRLFRGPVQQQGSPVYRNLCTPWSLRSVLKRCGFTPVKSAYANLFVFPLDRFPQLEVKVVAFLEPLCSVPVIQMLGSVYLVSSRKDEAASLQEAATQKQPH